MKKRLAIFGCSYAENINVNDHYGHYSSQGWSSQLADLYGPDQVDNFGLHTTSLQWSLNKFMYNYSYYNQLIFIVTSPGRLELPVKYTVKGTKPPREMTTRHWSGLSNFENVKKTIGRAEDPNALDFLENYFIYMTNNDLSLAYDYDYYQSAIAYIRRLAPHAIVIPSFPFAKDLYPEYTKWCLQDISLKEWPEGVSFWDRRPNHFTRDSNRFMLYHIRARLEQNRFLDWDPEQTTTYTSLAELEQAS
jgi:hypothetical protein